MGITFGPLASASDWDVLIASVDWGTSETVSSIRAAFESAGASSYVLEEGHTDRDFSAAFSSFYSSLFMPYQKLCRRLHVFASDVTPLLAPGTEPQNIAEGIEASQDDYLGFVVIRPLEHAPVGICVVSADDFANQDTQEISVQASYRVHLLGAELEVWGAALTQQDTRVGACAQATIWSVGRHFHTRHGAPWFSMADISDLALKPTDAMISQSLPAGSAFLTPDNMVRALKAMDRHPAVYARQQGGVWITPPRDVVCRYLDSGIPVILGLNRGATIGHAVVAVGREMNPARDPSTLPAEPTLAEGATHLFVVDDQRGPYRRLPIAEADRSPDYPWTLESDCMYMIVPLPAKVFMPAEHADTAARDRLKQVLPQRDLAYQQAKLKVPDASVFDADFESLGRSGNAVSRTYLTYGWRYRARALRNCGSPELKVGLLSHPLPRYVWVTEFSKPVDSFGGDPCLKRVHATVVHDATGSHLWDTTLIMDFPGFAILRSFESTSIRPRQVIEIIATGDPTPVWSKQRGWTDFGVCQIPLTSGVS